MPYGIYDEEHFDDHPNFLSDCLATYSQQRAIERIKNNQKFRTNRIYLAQPVVKRGTQVQIDSKDYSNRTTKQIIQQVCPPTTNNESFVTICIEREPLEEEEPEEDPGQAIVSSIERNPRFTT